MTQEELFKKLIAHCKEYGFVFPSSEIYDGLAAVYDYGQNGVELKNNIKRYWWDSMVKLHENIVGIDAAIFMHPRTWEASGHVGAFNDPLIDKPASVSERLSTKPSTAKLRPVLPRRPPGATRCISVSSRRRTAAIWASCARSSWTVKASARFQVRATGPRCVSST